MRPGRHQLADGGEPLEVQLLPREQRVPLEVRNHTLEEILEPSRLPLQGSIAAIGSGGSAPEVRLDRIKHLGAISILAYGEALPHLPADEQFRSRTDGDGEASLSVNIAGDIR